MEKVSKAWLSVLVCQGMLLYNQPLNITGYVVGTTQWGAFLVTAIAKGPFNIGWFEIAPTSSPWQFVPITHFDGWRAMMATPLSPAMLAKASKTDVVPDAIVLTGSANTLGVVAAKG